jgi:hydroxyethylthiazole kinase-like uncharacterized protein yjeF
MTIEDFKEEELKKLVKPHKNSSKEDNGQVTIIGGSKLFHGAPIFSLKVASRIVDMVFFSSPEPSIGEVAGKIKSQLNSFIWVPFEEVEEYIKKSDAILIGPGLMRYRDESKRVKEQESKKVLDEEGQKSKEITEALFNKFPNKQWVIDAGSLQVMETKFIPPNAILTPNEKEFELLFGTKASPESVSAMAKKHQCIILFKNVENLVCSPEECRVVKGGNAGLTKGGTGDVLAGLAVALVAENPPFLAACASAFLTKKTADELYKKVGFAYNADDLAEEVPHVLGQYWQ